MRPAEINLSSIEFHYLEVQNILSGLDANKAYGPDNLSSCILKECANVPAPSLTLLLKKSFASGHAHTNPVETSKCCTSSQEGKQITSFKLQTNLTFMHSI